MYGYDKIGGGNDMHAGGYLSSKIKTNNDNIWTKDIPFATKLDDNNKYHTDYIDKNYQENNMLDFSVSSLFSVINRNTDNLANQRHLHQKPETRPVDDGCHYQHNELTGNKPYTIQYDRSGYNEPPRKIHDADRPYAINRDTMKHSNTLRIYSRSPEPTRYNQ